MLADPAVSYAGKGFELLLMILIFMKEGKDKI